MIQLIIISVIYALVRSKHDSYLRSGKWKLWAFIEGVLFALVISFLLHGDLLMTGLGALVFGIVFWIVFDCMMGIYFGGNPLYIGNTGFDKLVKQVFCYTEKWKGLNYLIFKIIWAIVILGAYNSFKWN